MKLATVLNLALASFAQSRATGASPLQPRSDLKHLQHRGITIHPEGGIVIPEGSPAGFYRINFSEDGQNILNVTFNAKEAPFDPLAPNDASEDVQKRDEALKRLTARRDEILKKVEARQLPINYYRCFNSFLGETGWPLVWNDFKNFCEKGGVAAPHQAVAVTAGILNGVAWMCNKANVLNRCYAGEYDLFVSFIDFQCQSTLRSAFADVDPFFKSYGRSSQGDRFCQ